MFWRTFTHLRRTIVSEGFKGGTRGSPIMPRDAVSRTANVERNGGHKWGNVKGKTLTLIYSMQNFFNLEKFFFTFKLITEKPVAKFSFTFKLISEKPVAKFSFAFKLITEKPVAKFSFAFKLITEKPVAKFYGNIRNDGQYKQENEDIARNEQFAKQYMLPV